METVHGGLTAASGFRASGVACGIKKRGRDLALIVSDRPCAVAGALTLHSLRAASILWAEPILRKGRAQAIVAVSGNANACTGRRGMEDTKKTAQELAEILGLSASDVLVASTGVIGQFLPMEKIRSGIRRAVPQLSRTGSTLAACAVMTTDTRPKEFAVRLRAGRTAITVGGIAKGSGMISPRMATMLAFLTTDASVDAPTLRSALIPAVEKSFNAITVDGETSTNDMVLFLANGSSGGPPVKRGSPSYRKFMTAVERVCRHLAYEIVRDGEGVRRLMTVEVGGAPSSAAAQEVARHVANSPLVKTMVAGRDPNWGRIAAAVGAAGVAVDPRRLLIRLGQRTVFFKGEPRRVSRKDLLAEMDRPEVKVLIHLNRGRGAARLIGADLTEEYVRINAKYTS